MVALGLMLIWAAFGWCRRVKDNNWHSQSQSNNKIQIEDHQTIFSQRPLSPIVQTKYKEKKKKKIANFETITNTG